MIVAVLAHPASRLGRILGMKPLRSLGVCSYGIYLWHYPVIVLTSPTVNTGGVNIQLALGQTALSISLAAFSWFFIEDPIRCGKSLTAYCSAREQALRSLRDEGVALLDEVADEENFGLTRKNGHWYLQGRINYQSNGMAETMEFPINIIPPANLILYDTLYLSWQNIKDRVPNALDAFTSPNKDIAVIETKNKLYIYGISDEKLDSLPMGEIEMREGETVIMAEWATGSYVDIWERAFLANDAQVAENAP